MSEKKKAPGAAPGTNNGGGRKPSERKLVRVNRMIYADQKAASSEFIRLAIDAAIKMANPALLDEEKSPGLELHFGTIDEYHDHKPKI